MRKDILGFRRGMSIAALSVVVSAFVVIPSYADEASGSGSGDGSGSGASQSSNPSTSTSASGVGAGNSETNASNNGSDQAQAGSQSTGSATAGASAGSSNLGLGLGTTTSANASLNGPDSSSNSAASANGAVGAANLNVTVQAQATSTPGQLTAQAAGSDGSTAYAALGAITSLFTWVPSGVTKTMQNGQGTLSISCNAGGTCSQASIGTNSVYAGIRVVASDASSTGGVEAVLRAVLSAEAGAGWHEIFANAQANISGVGNSHGSDFASIVLGNANSRSRARIGPPIVTGSGSNWNATTSGGGTASGWFWSRGNEICASAYVKSKTGMHKVKKVSVCKQIAKQKTTAQRSIFENWFGAKGKKS